MLSQYFGSLSDQIDRMKKKWSGLTPEEKEKYFCRILELRELSDSFVEEWLLFEEKLIAIQRMVEQDLNINLPPPAQANTGSQHDGEQPDSSEVYVSLPMAAHFRKGQGYFELSMYKESAHTFSQLIEQLPDLSIARLFLAFGFFMMNDLERAHRHFRMLADTAEDLLVVAASCNALGCISVLEQRIEQGVVWFDRAHQHAPEFQDPVFNKALALYQAGRYAETLAVLDTFRNAEKDIEIQLLGFYASLKNRNRGEASFYLGKASHLASKKSTIRDRRAIALCYEQLGLFKKAADTYRSLLPEVRRQAWVWHSLGWSLWQHQKSEESIMHVKRALTIDPGNTEYACSYAWILLRTGNFEKAYRIFARIESTSNHPFVIALASAGKLEALLQLKPGDTTGMEEAKACAELLAGDTKPNIRAMGHYQSGKLALLAGNKKKALEHFLHSESLIREAEMYAGFLHYMDGDYRQAYTKWKGKQPVQ